MDEISTGLDSSTTYQARSRLQPPARRRAEAASARRRSGRRCGRPPRKRSVAVSCLAPGSAVLWRAAALQHRAAPRSTWWGAGAKQAAVHNLVGFILNWRPQLNQPKLKVRSCGCRLSSTCATRRTSCATPRWWHCCSRRPRRTSSLTTCCCCLTVRSAQLAAWPHASLLAAGDGFDPCHQLYHCVYLMVCITSMKRMCSAEACKMRAWPARGCRLPGVPRPARHGAGLL